MGKLSDLFLTRRPENAIWKVVKLERSPCPKVRYMGGGFAHREYQFVIALPLISSAAVPLVTQVQNGTITEAVSDLVSQVSRLAKPTLRRELL